MAKQLSNIREAKDYLVGQEILDVEINTDDPESPYIVIYLRGMRLYADAPALYSDDSGDAVAAF